MSNLMMHQIFTEIIAIKLSCCWIKSVFSLVKIVQSSAEKEHPCTTMLPAKKGEIFSHKKCAAMAF